MAGTPDLPVVLLPIQPRYAQLIIDGSKKVEFRKTVFRSEPVYVVIYASSPVQRVLGYFEVSDVEVDSIDSLFQKYSHIGCIGRYDYDDYYGDRDKGLVLRVGEVVALPEPLSLSDLGLSPRPPQSYAYVDANVVDLIDRRVKAHPRVPAVAPRLRPERAVRLGVAFA
jgi:predicted transcriptional regulator